MPLTYRYYLSDACFLAAIDGDEAALHGLHKALTRPHFPLYLGRRSCPPAGQVSLGVHSGSLVDVLKQWEWQAAPWYRRREGPRVTLQILHDALGQGTDASLVRDLPITFDPAHRQHAWRAVVRTSTQVDNPSALSASAAVADPHEPMALLGG
jgi:CRISPR system Cascade subunit CasD